jgi:hypothetical protein
MFARCSCKYPAPGGLLAPRANHLPEIQLMRAAYRPFAVFATLLPASCGGTVGHQTTDLVSKPNDPSPPAPAAGGPYLEYDRPLVFQLGVPEHMTADSVSSDTTITVTPELPVGLTLDTRTGTITGTPTVLSPGQSYALSAGNAQGTVIAKMNLEVDDGPLFYRSPVMLTVGTAMTPLAPSGTNYLSGFSVAPALPAGLSLDTRTGTILGTPTDLSAPTYYTVSGADMGFRREYGLTLGVVDASAIAPRASNAPYNCAQSGGFVGTFAADFTDGSYGLVAIAFTPDGNAHARVANLTTKTTYDSDGLEGLSAAMDGSFMINFSASSSLSLRGKFVGPDLISGTYQNGTVSKPFTAARLGGSPSATYRYTGGFGIDNVYRVDFGTIDVTGSALTGVGYQMAGAAQDFVLVNRELPFGATISNGQFSVTVDASTTQGTYVKGQSRLTLGDPYDGLLFLDTDGCQLN